MRQVAVCLPDRTDEVGSDIQVEGHGHQFHVAKVVIFVLIDALEPGVKLLIVQLVVLTSGL